MLGIPAQLANLLHLTSCEMEFSSCSDDEESSAFEISIICVRVCEFLASISSASEL